MPTTVTTAILDHLCGAVLRGGVGRSDGELLGDFVERHDEAALAALVRRHGPMVWGVCCRLLSHHDAEDAFQATFLVLVRKASSISPRSLVGNWLYGVAHQTALHARRTAARRRAKEVQVKEMPDTAVVQNDLWSDLRAVLDEELSRLPDTYRAVVVLCDLEGRTRKGVALQLGVPEGTVAGRLARARAMLAKRLARRGVTLSCGALAAMLAQNVAAACVPNSVVSSTIQTVTTVAAGQAVATGAISGNVAALTEGVLKTMLVNKLKAVLALTLALGLVALGATALTFRTAVGQDDREPTTEKPDRPAVRPKPEVKEEEKVPAKPKRVYTPEELIREANSLKPDEKVTVQFKVRLVQPSPRVAGHGPDDIGLYPYDRLDWTQKQFTAILTTKANQQLKRLGVEDAGKHFSGRVIRVTGRITSYLPLTDDPVSERQYELVLDDLSQIESVEKLATGKLERDVPAERPADAKELTVGHRFTVHLNKVAPWPRAAQCAFLDNDRILVQAGTGKIEIRDAKTGKLLKSVELDKQDVGEFRLSADRKSVAAMTIADTTGTTVIPSPDVTVWDTTTWKVRGRIDYHRLLALAADGRTVLVRDDDGWGEQSGKVAVWDVVANKKLKTSPFEFKTFDAAAFSPDGSLVAVSGLNEIAYWKWREDGDKFDRLKVGRKVDALVFSPDSKLVAEGPDSRMSVQVRDVATLKVAQTLSDPGQPRVDFSVAGLAFADGGKTLALGNRTFLIETIPVPHRIHFWDVKTGKLIQKIELKGGAPFSLDVSPDGKTLATVTADNGVSLRVFDLDQGNGTPKK